MASSSRRDYQNPSVDDDDDLIDPDDADLNEFDDPLQTSSRAPLTGNIGSSSAAAAGASSSSSSAWTSRIPGEDRRAAGGTIDETVWATLQRDLLAVWHKLRAVLWPRHLLGGTALDSESGVLRGAYAALRGAYAALRGGTARDELAGIAGRAVDAEALLAGGGAPALPDWDLWGPLVFCLLLALLLSWHKGGQRDVVFSGVFAIVWIGEAVVTLQIKLLGGNISFAQSVCVIGYTLFPLVVAALLSAVGLPLIPRVPVYIVLVAWSLAAGVSILSGSGVLKNRVGLAVYPLMIYYLGLGCLCFIS